MSKKQDRIDAEAQVAGKKVAWRCKVCGHIEKGHPTGLPDGYVCPVCGASAKKFEKIWIDY